VNYSIGDGPSIDILGLLGSIYNAEIKWTQDIPILKNLIKPYERYTIKEDDEIATIQLDFIPDSKAGFSENYDQKNEYRAEYNSGHTIICDVELSEGYQLDGEISIKSLAKKIVKIIGKKYPNIKYLDEIEKVDEVAQYSYSDFDIYIKPDIGLENEEASNFGFIIPPIKLKYDKENGFQNNTKNIELSNDDIKISDIGLSLEARGEIFDTELFNKSLGHVNIYENNDSDKDLFHKLMDWINDLFGKKNVDYSIYEPTLWEYKESLSKFQDGNEDVFYGYTGAGTSIAFNAEINDYGNLSYTLYDIDRNGIKELIVGAWDDSSSKFGDILHIYSIESGTVQFIGIPSKVWYDKKNDSFDGLEVIYAVEISKKGYICYASTLIDEGYRNVDGNRWILNIPLDELSKYQGKTTSDIFKAKNVSPNDIVRFKDNNVYHISQFDGEVLE